VNLRPLRNCCGHRASRSDFGGRYLEISEANSAGKPVRRAVSECRVIRPELLLNPAAAASVSALTQHQNFTCRIVKVVVMRRKTDAFADPKVSEVVVNMDRLEEEVAAHAQGVDVALAAFGVGKGSAKMPEEEVRKIEIAYPQAFCRAAKAGGARVCGVMTATGADPESGMKYAKIVGEKEKAVESVKFDFLGIYRPAVILGNANTPSVLNYLMPLLHWAMPSKYHSIHKNDLARALVAQSEQAFFAIAQGNHPKEPIVKILEYKEMEPFFVEGEGGEA